MKPSPWPYKQGQLLKIKPWWNLKPLIFMVVPQNWQEKLNPKYCCLICICAPWEKTQKEAKAQLGKPYTIQRPDPSKANKLLVAGQVGGNNWPSLVDGVPLWDYLCGLPEWAVEPEVMGPKNYSGAYPSSIKYTYSENDSIPLLTEPVTLEEASAYYASQLTKQTDTAAADLFDDEEDESDDEDDVDDGECDCPQCQKKKGNEEKDDIPF